MRRPSCRRSCRTESPQAGKDALDQAPAPDWRRLDLPPAGALQLGGIGIAFIPGLPAIELDPEFIPIVFLPPLLMEGAYLSSWDEMKRNIGAILSLAIGLVLVRFAVAAALTGLFSIEQATGEFAILSVGCVVVAVKIMKYLWDEYLIITASMLAAWISYLLGEAIGVSGVIATVLCGMTIGWLQHEVFTAAVRLRVAAFWQVVIFLLERRWNATSTCRKSPRCTRWAASDPA